MWHYYSSPLTVWYARCMTHSIVLKGDQFWFDGTLLEGPRPYKLSAFIALLGQPTSSNDWTADWDGISLNISGGNVMSMRLYLQPSVIDPSGTTYYEGAAEVNGVDLRRENFKLEPYLGSADSDFYITLLLNDDDTAIAHITILMESEDVNRPTNDFVIRQPRGKVLTFTDFNFKLLIIDELMYEQKILDPPFYLTEYADHANINLEEHLGETIDGAREYFEKLPIPAKFAKNIRSLEQDGGMQIYSEIAYQWDGEDDRFAVHSLRDAAQFPNLKTISLLAQGDVDGVDDLRNKGVTVTGV